MEQIKASQGEGKKRRSFLPSFKKPSPLSPTSPQPPSNTCLPTLLPSVSTVTLLTSSPIVHLPTVTPAPAVGPSFGYGGREPSAISRPHATILPSSRIQAPSVPTKEKEVENVAYGVGLRVGARVKISGVKPGILRYLGTTHLAPGIFCGIELYDPDGNHDGEVNGHRYFTCAPNHGIFAPKEKVCLETSSSLGRLASDSTDCYSSTESLSERTHKAFKTFEEGELEAIDCSKLSPIISPQDVDTVDDATLTRHHRSSKLHSTSQFTSPYRVLDPGLSTDSLESQDSLDIPQKRSRSGLPRAKSSLPTVTSVSKLPTFSRPSTKYSESPPPPYQRKIAYANQPGDPQLPDVGLRSQQSPVLTDSDQEREKYRAASARSSEDSEEDGFLRDTLSRGIKKQLRADSRQYLNFTFDPEVSQSVDQEDSEDGDDTTYTSGHVSAVNPLFIDPLFVRDFSGDSSDDGAATHEYNTRYLEQTLPVAQGGRIYFVEGGEGSQQTVGHKTLDASRSRSYTVERGDRQQVLDMSLSGSESNEDATRLSVTHSISDSDLPQDVLPQVDDHQGPDGGGFSAGYGCCDEDRLSEGYVPDTDSEFGTLTTNSPNMDWVDRQGVAHPTSYAPGDDRSTEDMDFEMNEKMTSVEKNPTSGHSSDLGVKRGEDDDYNGGNTEDDRIEADQVYGLRASGPKSHGECPPELHQTMDVDAQGGSGREDSGNEVSGDSGDNSSHKEFEPLPSTNSVAGHKDNDENKDVNERKKENAAQQRKPQTKKITITKKRSENIDHKMPNINVTSKLADYIKTPVPVKPREEKEPKKVLNKNAKNIQKRLSVDGSRTPKLDTSRSSSAEREKDRDESMDREKFDKPEKVKPLIKRAPPKSKWGNIMSQIEASKDTVKPKPKSEIKSSLAAYLSTPVPQLSSENNALTVNMVKADQQPTVKKREFVKRIKALPPPPPKIDLSKIKSKLNVPTAASAVKAVPKRDASPGNRRNKTVVRASRDSSPADHSVTSELKESFKKRLSADGHIVLLRQGMSTTVSSVRSSHTDLSLCASMDSVGESRGDVGTPSKRGSVDLTVKPDRRYSTSSLKSDHSEKTRCNGDQAKGSQDHRSRRSKVNSIIQSHNPNMLPTRTLEIRLGDASAVSSQRSSPTPVIVKPIKPKPKNNANAKTNAAKPVWGATKPSPPPAKGRDSSANQGRKTRLNISAKISSNVQSNTTSTPAPSTAAQKEIVRLVSLCEARTKELTHAKIQLKATSQGFDAMAVLVNYCCSELNAFECPVLAEKLVTVQRQLTDCLAQIAVLTTQKDELDKNLTQVIQEKDQVCKQIEETLQLVLTEREEHAKMTKDLDDTHNAALTTQRDELTTKHEEALKKFLQYYDKQTEFLKQSHERQLSEVKNESKLEMNGLRISHLEEIQELRNKHDSQMEELHKQHRNKLEDITHRFETIKLSLSEKVESLRGECEDLRHRARNSEEALQRDADVKVQMALAPFMSLPAEIESLKTVVEMRNEEIQKLRTKNMDLEKQLEEVPIGREKIISLQQKVENLEAIINIKSDHEKQMHEHCQVLMRKYDRASRANKRLSMDYEQVMWRMSQSSEFGSSESLTQRQLSRSPTRSERGSPDGRHRTLSPNSAGEVVMRKKRNSHSVGEGDRKLRSRSATFVLEKHESSDSHSPSSSPQPKLKRWRKKSEVEEKSSGKTKAERMCHSAGAELISDLISQEAWVDKGEKASLQDTPDSLTSSIDNADSYTRSVSGVSDSGVYDSMTRSDMLNSSVVSTDSEWATSVNLSMNLDSTMDDLDSGPKSGDYVSLNDVTVIAKPGGNKSAMKSSNTVVFCLDKNLDPILEPSKVIDDTPTSEYTRPETADDVFDESISMESSCCSFDNFDVTSVSDSRLTSASEDLSANETVVDTVSDITLTCNISLEKSMQNSSTSQNK